MPNARRLLLTLCCAVLSSLPAYAQSVTATVAAGTNPYEFHFRTHLFGTGVALDAFELRDEDPDGYYFQIIGNPEDDLLVLLGRLVEKMRRALSVRHLMDGEHGLQIAAPGVVRGRIEWDDAHRGRLPLLVIDGREIDWDEFGRMLMSFEGSQFQLNLADKSEEL